MWFTIRKCLLNTRFRMSLITADIIEKQLLIWFSENVRTFGKGKLYLFTVCPLHN